MAGAPPFGIDRKRAIVGLAVAACLAIGAVGLISQATDVGKAVDAVKRAEKSWFFLCLVGQLLAYAGYALGYRTIVRACNGPVLAYWTTLRLTVVSFGAYVIASTAGGLAVDFWAVTRAGEARHRASRRILAFNILEWAILGACAAAAGVANLAGAGHRAPLAISVGWIVALIGSVAGALWFSSPRRKERFIHLPVGDEPADPGPDVRRWTRWASVNARKGFSDAIGALNFLRMLLARPVRYAGAPGGFALYWVGDVVTLYGALRALGGAIGPSDLLLAYATGYVVTSLPLPGGASGFSEASTAYALHLVGVPLGTAIFAVLAYRLFTFWLPIAPAVAMLRQVGALNDELPRSGREPDAPCDLAVER